MFPCAMSSIVRFHLHIQLYLCSSAHHEALPFFFLLYVKIVSCVYEKDHQALHAFLFQIANMKKEIDAIRVKDISQGGLTQGQQTQIARNEQRISQVSVDHICIKFY